MRALHGGQGCISGGGVSAWIQKGRVWRRTGGLDHLLKLKRIFNNLPHNHLLGIIPSIDKCTYLMRTTNEIHVMFSKDSKQHQDHM